MEMKRLLSMVLVLCMVLALLPAGALADSIATVSTDYFTVYVKIDLDTVPYAWAWGDYGNAFSAWPGVEMSAHNGWWAIDVPYGSTGFIVNNGSSQTADISIYGDRDCWIDVSSDFNEYSVSYVAPAGFEVIVPADYYVTGSTDIFGNWAVCNTNGSMVLKNGLYVRSFSMVPAGEYELKVNDGTADNAWGINGEPIKFTVEEENSTVIVRFNSVSKTVNVEVYGPDWDSADVSIADGDYYIVCPASGQALSAMYSGSYNAAADVTISGTTVTGAGASEIWTVTNNADGTIQISNNGSNIAMGYSSYYMTLGATYDDWALSYAGSGLVYVKNDYRGRYMMYDMSYDRWSTTTIIGDYCKLRFIPVNGEVDTPDENDPSVPKLVDGVYEIQTADQLYWFSNQVYAGKNDINGKLMADIVVNENVLTADGKLNSGAFRVWKPIGNGVTHYAGTFDGNGHTISGLYFNDASKTQIGLFGSVGGTVKNVALLDSYLNGYKFVGGIAGENVGTIYSCFSTATVIGSFSVGGVAGYNSGTVTNCFYLTGRAPANNIGGSRTADEFAMGEVAYLLQGEQTEHIWGQSIGTDPLPKRGGEKVYMVTTCDGYGIGYSNDPNAQLGHLYQQEVCLPTCEEGGFTIHRCFYCGDTYIDSEVDALGHQSFTNGFCALCDGYQNAVYHEGVYEISNAGQLYWFASRVNAGEVDISAKLMADIVINENVLSAEGELNQGDWRIWTPMNWFEGTFDGNSKTISGLVMANDHNYQGLFGSVEEGGLVRNVGVVDSFVEVFNWDEKGSCYAGAIAGYNKGTVSGCYNKGTINAVGDVGGVVGYNYNGTVTDCYNTGAVSARGNSDYVGGVVGYNYCSSYGEYALADGCYNTGTVTAYSDNRAYVGGVVGYNNGYSASYLAEIMNCYNIGSVSASANDDNYYTYVGGVAGYSDDGRLDNCYNTGNVSGSAYAYSSAYAYVGGVVGRASGSNLSDCHNTGNVSGSAYTTYYYSYAYVGGVVGRAYDSNLSNCHNTGEVKGSATADDYADGYYTYVGGVAGIFCSDYGYSGMVSDCYNTGSVVGENYTGGVIGSVYFSSSNSSITIEDCYNTGSVVGENYTGGVVGYNRSEYGNVTISSCYNTATVTGQDYTGGVVGYNTSENSNYRATVTNCYNTGAITGASNVGGVVGYNTNVENIPGVVTNCYNTGTVTGTGNYVGAVAGRNDGYLTVCYYRTGCAKDGSNKLQFGIGHETMGSFNRDIAGVTAGKSAAAFASGEVCVLLQGDQGEQIWGQRIGTDLSPVLGGEPVYVYNGNYFNKTEEPCQHTYQSSVTKPTCTTDGFTTYTCTACGDSYQENVVKATGHSWQAANCQSAKTCTACGITEGGLGDHSYEKAVTAPGCMTDGYTVFTCKFCSHSYRGDYTVATGHSWAEADCTQPMHCTVCALTRGQALGHIFGETTVHKPASGVQGYSEHTCTICGFNEKFAFVDFKGVSVSGTVTGYLDGDVTVQLLQGGEVVYSVTTSDGSYAIDGVVAGDYTLRISKENHAPKEVAVTVGKEAVTQDATIYPIGDLSGDGVVNIKDFQRLLRHVNKTNPLTDYELVCGDVTGDGVCNIKDFQRLLRHVNKTNPLF